jgi:phage portal protein BeeE
VPVSWFGRTLKAFGLQVRDAASDLIGFGNRNGQRVGSETVNPESALRHSAVWACLRLRANLVSSMPLDVFRPSAATLVEVTKPRLLIEPAPGVDITEWMWSTQFDLDRFGNCFGLITERDSLGRPVQVELLAAADVSVLTKGRRITGYRVGGDVLDPALIWHERQYVVAGSPVGLSPIAYAAMSIGGYLSAQQFALDWYTSGAAPGRAAEEHAAEISQKSRPA